MASQQLDGEKATADSKEDAAETAQPTASSFEYTAQKGPDDMPAQAEIEQERNDKGQGVSCSGETGKTKETLFTITRRKLHYFSQLELEKNNNAVLLPIQNI